MSAARSTSGSDDDEFFRLTVVVPRFVATHTAIIDHSRCGNRRCFALLSARTTPASSKSRRCISTISTAKPPHARPQPRQIQNRCPLPDVDLAAPRSSYPRRLDRDPESVAITSAVIAARAGTTRDKGSYGKANDSDAHRDRGARRGARFREVQADPDGDRGGRVVSAAARSGHDDRGAVGGVALDTAGHRHDGRRPGRHRQHRSARHGRSDRVRIRPVGARGRVLVRLDARQERSQLAAVEAQRDARAPATSAG